VVRYDVDDDPEPVPMAGLDELPPSFGAAQLLVEVVV
jgi:hypothetical protein